MLLRSCLTAMLGLLVLLSLPGSLPGWAAEDKNSENPLVKIADVPLPGPAVRFDYQSLDQTQGRLYVSHMNADQLLVFDVKKNQVVANLDGFPRVHGVWAVPELSKVYASTTGEHNVAAVDMKTLKTVARVGPIDYPDGLAYAPRVERVFVSDEHGGVDAVIDTKTNTLIARIPLGGGAGNTVYDSGSQLILVAVHGKNELVRIDPVTMRIVDRVSLPGGSNPHGIAIDVANRLAFVACEGNGKLFVVDLANMKVLASHPVGDDPDVLAFDPGLGLLYVAAESGDVTIFRGWPDGAAALEWQWNERVIPYWTETAKFARDHGVHQIALEMHPNFVVYNPRTLMRLRAAVGPEIGANCDLSHLFWQGCDAVEVIRFLAQEKALFHAHMKDTTFFPQNVARYGVLNFAKSKNDHEGSEFFRAIGYGHGASFWKDVIAAYMEVGYDGMLSIENEDPILSAEVGVERALATLKNVRGEILAN